MRTLATCLLFHLIPFSICLAQVDYRQWEPANGVPLRMGSHLECFQSTATRYQGANTGEVALVWSDTRRGDRDIYIQVFDPAGRMRFPANGLLVNGAEREQQDPVVCPDLDGGWFIAWEDFQSDSLGEIFCTKIDSTGRILWGDAENGIPATANPLNGSQQWRIEIIADTAGGCYLIWLDQRGGDPSNIYAQHVTFLGQIDEIWPEDGLPIVTDQGFQTGHKAISDGMGGFIICWQDGNNIRDFNILADRISRAGEHPWGEAITICGEEFSQGAPQICSDGEGGAFICWIDFRNQDNREDIYAQRIDENGESRWTENGAPVCQSEGGQERVRMIASNEGEAILTWEDYREDGMTADIYAAKIGGDEQIELLWDAPTGLPVAVAERNQAYPMVAPDNDGGAYIIWDDERIEDFPRLDVFIQHLDRAGDPIWRENGVPVFPDGQGQTAIGIGGIADGGCMVIWNDFWEGPGIFGQRFSADGDPEWEGDGRLIVGSLGGNATTHTLINNPDGSVTVCWLDGRNGSNGTFPYIQTIGEEGGQPVGHFESNGIPVLTGTQGGSASPSICSDGDRGTFVVWEDHRVGETYSIYTQRINSEGERLWSDAGIKVAEYEDEQSEPIICPDDAGGAFICWRAHSQLGDNDIFLQRLNSAGDRLFGQQGIFIAHTEADEHPIALLPDGEGGIVIVWIHSVLDMETFIWDSDIYAGRFNSRGRFIWEDGAPGVPIVAIPGSQSSCDIAAHPDGWVIVWEDERLGREENNVIYGQFINRDGTLRWEENGALICSAVGDRRQPSVAVDRGGYIWVTWIDRFRFNQRNRSDVFLQKIHPVPDDQGRLQTYFFTPGDPDSAYGKRICAADFDQSYPELLADGSGGAWILWQDYRGNGIHSDIYATHLDQYGNPFEGWEDNGNVISEAWHKQDRVLATLLSPGGNDGIFMVWEDKRATGMEELSNIFCQKVDDDMAVVRHEPAGGMPTEMAIEGVYPNPSNGRATVDFSVSKADLYSVKIVDLAGREVMKINDRWLEAGRYKIDLDLSGLASGSYNLVPDTPAGSTGRSVVLIK